MTDQCIYHRQRG